MMGFEELAQFLVTGLKNGSIYSLIALGFSIVYATSGAINLAQGEFFMLGGMLTWWFTDLGLPLVLSGAAAVVSVAAIAAVFERLAIRPLAGGDHVRVVMVTIGGSLLMRQAAFHAFGPDEKPVPLLVGGAPLRILGASVERQTVAIWVVVAVVVTGLAIVYRRTLLGKALRATAEQPVAARLSGIDVRSMMTWSFAAAGALGALGGFLIAPLMETWSTVGTVMGLKGFGAAVLGGLGNPVFAVVGGLIMGVLEALSVGYLDGAWKDVVVVGVTLAVLFVRPSGLFGQRDKDKS